MIESKLENYVREFCDAHSLVKSKSKKPSEKRLYYKKKEISALYSKTKREEIIMEVASFSKQIVNKITVSRQLAPRESRNYGIHLQVEVKSFYDEIRKLGRNNELSTILGEALSRREVEAKNPNEKNVSETYIVVKAKTSKIEDIKSLIDGYF